MGCAPAVGVNPAGHDTPTLVTLPPHPPSYEEGGLGTEEISPFPRREGGRGDGGSRSRGARLFGGAFVFAAILLVPLPLFSAHVRLLTLAELVESSDLVVLAVPGAARAAREASGRVVRRVPLAIEERVAGTAPAAVEVVLLGGEADGIGTLVPGEAELPAGEPALLFLEALPGSPGSYRVTGLAQGRFAVVRDPASGARFAARTLSGSFVPPPDGIPDDPEDLGVGRPRTCLFVPLGLLLERIRALGR